MAGPQTCANTVTMECGRHIDYFVDTFNLPRDRFSRVFVGAVEPVAPEGLSGQNVPEGLSGPAVPEGLSGPDRAGDTPFRVLFVGKFIPLHGLPFMMEAANRLKDVPDIVFHFVGTGQLTDEIHETARRLNLENVRFTDWIPYERVHRFLQGRGVCLGIFGTSGKAARVIPGKVFVALSAGKAVSPRTPRPSRSCWPTGKRSLCGAGDRKRSPGHPPAHGDRELLDKMLKAARVFETRFTEQTADRVYRAGKN